MTAPVHTFEVYFHGAFILTHGVEVKDATGAVVWSNLYSSESAAEKAGAAKVAELSKKA